MMEAMDDVLAETTTGVENHLVKVKSQKKWMYLLINEVCFNTDKMNVT